MTCLNGGFMVCDVRSHGRPANGGFIGALPRKWTVAIWRKALASKALACGLPALPGQSSWTEIPFGIGPPCRNDLPWAATMKVEIPGTGLRIRGYIDRLDVSNDKRRARVIDYKTGRIRSKQAGVILGGDGSQLWRAISLLPLQIGTGKTGSSPLTSVACGKVAGGDQPANSHVGETLYRF